MLTATQEGNYKGTEGFGAIPFDGIVLAHSNESEWKAFRNNRNNEAFLDRVYIVKVPTAAGLGGGTHLRKADPESSLASAVSRAGTLKMMAQFAVLTTAQEPENSSIFSKMQVYDGESLKDTDPRAKSYQEYRTMPAWTRACRASPPALPSRSCPRCSTTTAPRWRPTQCT
ncbi:hypothetical protein ACFODQ_00845 [Comamonas sp. JC664]